VLADLFVRRPIPTTLFQITPQLASGREGHTAVDAFVRSDDGKHLGVVVEDQEAGPTGGCAIACAEPFHFHDTSTQPHRGREQMIVIALRRLVTVLAPIPCLRGGRCANG